MLGERLLSIIVQVVIAILIIVAIHLIFTARGNHSRFAARLGIAYPPFIASLAFLILVLLIAKLLGWNF